MVKIPVGIPQVLWLRGEIPVGYFKCCGGEDPGWDTSSFWPRGENAGRIPKCFGVVQIPVGTPQVLWLRGGENPGRIALVTECCGFVAKIPVGIPQVLWLRGENPGRIPQVL